MSVDLALGLVIGHLS